MNSISFRQFLIVLIFCLIFWIRKLELRLINSTIVKLQSQLSSILMNKQLQEPRYKMVSFDKSFQAIKLKNYTTLCMLLWKTVDEKRWNIVFVTCYQLFMNAKFVVHFLVTFPKLCKWFWLLQSVRLSNIVSKSLRWREIGCVCVARVQRKMLQLLCWKDGTNVFPNFLPSLSLAQMTESAPWVSWRREVFVLNVTKQTVKYYYCTREQHDMTIMLVNTPSFIKPA